MLDFITINFSAGNGYLNWSTGFDGYGAEDGAVRITGSSTTLSVMGAVRYSNNVWQYAVLIIRKSDGVITRSFIYSGGTSDIEKVTDLKTDDDENIYICGTISNPNTALDLYVVKLDSLLNVQWEYIYNGKDSLNDEAHALYIDNGYAYIIGYTTHATQDKNYITIKLKTNTGDKQWAVPYNHPCDGEDVATALVIDDNANVYVTGYSFNGNNFDYLTIKYDTDSNMIWVKSFDNYNNDDKASDIGIDNLGKIIVTGQSNGSSTYSYFTVQYAEYIRNLNLDDKETHIENEIIIRFSPELVDSTMINRKGKIIGSITDFITDGNLIEDMGNILGFELYRNVKLLKVHKNLTTHDTISITRLGEQIRIPEFWSTFVMLVDEQRVGVIDVFAACDDLYDNFFPDIIYANPNFVGVLMGNPPDDTFYDDQTSLSDTLQLDVERAWDYEVGKPCVKVGIYDSGVMDNEDFYNNGIDKVKHYEYSGSGITSHPHGTMVTSVIGANRNNSYGIAGIAGGDVIDSANYGVSLYDMRIYNFVLGGMSIDAVLNAICEGATQATYFGLGHNVMNHSWGIVDIVDIETYYKSLKEQILWAYKNNVVTVAARGNKTCPQDGDKLVYPACYLDGWVINVGALHSGINLLGNSMYGQRIDFIAPGLDSNIVSIPPGFCHTSAASAHISGLTALMLSYYNDSLSQISSLATEDVQNLLKMGAQNWPYASGYYLEKFLGGNSMFYNSTYGWGVANAFYTFYLLNKNNCKIIHRDTTILFNSNIYIYSSETIKIKNDYYKFDNIGQATFAIQQGEYPSTEVYQVDIQIPNNLPLGYQIDSIWVRNSSSNLWGYQANSPMSPIDSIQIVDYNPTASNTTLRGYVYNFINYEFFPINDGDSAKFAYTIYASQIPTGINENTENEINFSISPNPAHNSVLVNINLENNKEFSIQIFDITGRCVLKENHKNSKQTIILDISKLNTGLYFVNIQANNQSNIKKLIVY